jgi:hypothetical protein
MSCTKYDLMASVYVDRRLSPAEADEYRSHLSDCAGCRQHLAEIEQVSLALKSAPEPVLPVELRSYVMTAVERQASNQVAFPQRALEWLLKLNPQPVSYLAGVLASTVLFAILLSGLKPIPVISGEAEQFVIIPATWGSDPEYHAYNGLPPDSAAADREHAYQLPRVLNNSSLVSFSHIAYQRPGNEGMAALVEIEPDGRAKLVDMLDEPSDPYLVEQLWWSLSKRAFQPAILEGRAVPTRIVLLVEKMDVAG